MQNFKEISIKKIKPSPNNYRKPTKEAMKDLIESIKSKGVIQPILVRPLNGNGTFEIVAGHRRYTAALEAGLKEMPAIIRALSDEDALELQVIENSQREDPNPMEEAWGFKKLLDLGKHTIDTLADKIKCSLKYVTGRLNLLNLPKDAQKKIMDEEISIGHAMLLTRLKNPVQQKELLEAIIEENLSVKDAKDALENFSHDISNAVFDTAECEKCPYLSRNQTILFPELKESSECMDEKCYMKKTREHYKVLFIDLEKKGFKCITDNKEYETVSRGAQQISPPNQKGSYVYHNVPERYKSECMKCTEFHVFCAYEEKDYRDNTHFETKELCLDRKCFNEMQYGKRTGESENNGNGDGNGRVSEYKILERARFCRDRFLRKTLPDIIKGPHDTAAATNRSLNLRARLLIYHLLDRFKNFEGRTKFIKKYFPEFKDVYAYREIYHAVKNFPQDKLGEAVSEIVLLTINATDPNVLLVMTGEAGIDMSKDFSPDKEFLQTKTKEELIKFVDTHNLEVKASPSDKKGAIVDAILTLDLRGKLPAELVEVCKIEEPESDSLDDGEPVCRVCGCTDSTPCEGGCEWVDDPEEEGDLCSACLKKIESADAGKSVSGKAQKKEHAKT